jgi:hypothetical protein
MLAVHTSPIEPTNVVLQLREARLRRLALAAGCSLL